MGSKSNPWLRQHRPRFDQVVRYVPDTATAILEVGAAPYHLTEHITRACADADLYAIDLEDKTEPPAEVDRATCNVETEVWPFDDDSMDCIVMGAILEHLFDPLAAIDEARRVLDDDGTLVISVPQATRLKTRVETLLGKNPFDDHAVQTKYGRHQHEWTRDELADILDVGGFGIVDETCLALGRKGMLGQSYQFICGLNPDWADQIVVQCRPVEPAPRSPVTYRENVVNRVVKQ